MFAHPPPTPSTIRRTVQYPFQPHSHELNLPHFPASPSKLGCNHDQRCVTLHPQTFCRTTSLGSLSANTPQPLVHLRVMITCMAFVPVCCYCNEVVPSVSSVEFGIEKCNENSDWRMSTALTVHVCVPIRAHFVCFADEELICLEWIRGYLHRMAFRLEWSSTRNGDHVDEPFL